MRLPAKILHSDSHTLIWHAYAAVLAQEGAFRGLVWPDPQMCAWLIVTAITHDQAADELRNNGRNALSGADGIQWRDRDAVARAFVIAADALGPKPGR
jgi:hypothetical protein